MDHFNQLRHFLPVAIIKRFLINNAKIQVKCGGLRRTPNSKILFSLFLYIGVTLKFTWGYEIQD